MAEPAPLSGKTLNEIVPGASVHLDTPLGTKLPVKYSSNGLISGEAGGLAWFLGSASDRGRWWVSDDKLCQKFFKWFDAEVQCLRLKRDGDKLYWSRDDGKTGTATLIAAAPIDRAPFGLGHPASAETMNTFAPVPHATAQANPAEPVVRAAVPVAPHASKPPPKAQPVQQATAKKAPAPVPLAVAAVPATVVATTAAKSVAAKASVSAAVPAAAAKPASAGALLIAAAPPKMPLRAATATSIQNSPVEPVAFRVSGVHPGDVLNVRQGPSSETAPVGVIPPFADGVMLAGVCQLDWCPVRHGAVSGWVNRYYLREED